MPKETPKMKTIKDIEKELNLVQDFMSAEENQDFAFSMAEAEEREKQLLKLLNKIKAITQNEKPTA